MTIFLQPLVVILTIVASVTAAPSRIAMGPLSESNIGYPLGGYYDPFDPPAQLPREEIMKLRRNLDRIGGGNLLRNLHHIGGGHLLREVKEPEKSGSGQSPNGEKVNDENSGVLTGGRQFIVNPKDIQSSYDGGDLIKDSQFEKNDPWIQNLQPVNDRLYSTGPEFNPYFNEADQKKKHHQGHLQGNPNSPQTHIELIEERNLDHIGGGNLLRDLGDPEDYRILRVDNEDFF